MYLDLRLLPFLTHSSVFPASGLKRRIKRLCLISRTKAGVAGIWRHQQEGVGHGTKEGSATEGSTWSAAGAVPDYCDSFSAGVANLGVAGFCDSCFVIFFSFFLPPLARYPFFPSLGQRAGVSQLDQGRGGGSFLFAFLNSCLDDWRIMYVEQWKWVACDIHNEKAFS